MFIEVDRPPAISNPVREISLNQVTQTIVSEEAIYNG